MKLYEVLDQQAAELEANAQHIRATMKILMAAEVVKTSTLATRLKTAVHLRHTANGHSNGTAPAGGEVWERFEHYLASQPKQRARLKDVIAALGASTSAIFRAVNEHPQFKKVGRGVYALRKAHSHGKRDLQKPKRKFVMSEKGRRAIAKAQKARWAAHKAAGKTGRLESNKTS